MSNLGTYIARLRDEKDWSQSDLAKKAGCSQNTIHKIETGQTEHPGIDVLVSVAKALKVPVYTLILAYQGKEPDFKEVVDKPTLETALKRAIKNVLKEHFPD